MGNSDAAVQNAADNNGGLTANPSMDNDMSIKIVLDFKRLVLLGLFLFVFFPLLPIILASIFGGLFALCEPDTTYRQGFLYVISNLLGMANPLTEYSPTVATTAVILDMYVAICALVVFGIMLNIVNLFEVPMAINNLIEKCVKNAFLVALIGLGILIPIWNAVLCCAFGALLAVAEGWGIVDGILYVFTNTLGLATPLTDVVPTTVGGALLDIIISSVALGYIAIFADYVTVLNPSKTIRRKFRAMLGKLGVIDLEKTPRSHPLGERYSVSFNQPPIVMETTEASPSDVERNLPRPPSKKMMGSGSSESQTSAASP